MQKNQRQCAFHSPLINKGSLHILFWFRLLRNNRVSQVEAGAVESALLLHRITKHPKLDGPIRIIVSNSGSMRDHPKFKARFRKHCPKAPWGLAAWGCAHCPGQPVLVQNLFLTPHLTLLHVQSVRHQISTERGNLSITGGNKWRLWTRRKWST